MATTKVLIAVGSQGLARAIQHVLHGECDISSIDFADPTRGLLEQAQRLSPELIIVNSRWLGWKTGAALTQLKHASPHSKLIQTCSFEEFGKLIEPGVVDARVLEETLVRRLPSIVRRLTGRTHATRSVFQVLGFLLAFFLHSFSASASVSSIDAATHAPPHYYTLQPPAAGATYVDPVFGSTIKRMSNSLNEPNTAMGAGTTLPFISDEYSSMSPYNSDNSRILGLHFSYFGLYDGTGRFLKNLNVCSSCEPRWSRTNPNILYFISGNQLRRLDVSSDGVSVVHTFREYTSIGGKGESDISVDGDHFVFVGDSGSVFVYEISTDVKGPVLDTGGRGFDSLYITPNNSVTITWFQAGTARYNGIELFDSNMNFLRQVTRAGGHMDIASDSNGDEILLWANSADPVPICTNAIVKVRLSDAHQTCLISVDWSLAVHVSAPDSGGWFFMETYAPVDPTPGSVDWKPYMNEILQVKLDGSEVRRLAHHRSRPFDGYNYTPRASASHDGSSLIFSTNFGLYGPSTIYTDLYLMMITPPSPLPTLPPPPTPNPVPAAHARIRTVQAQTVDAFDVAGVLRPQTGYGSIDGGVGAAVLRSFSGEDLVAEAAIPASVAANDWITYAEESPRVSTGIAVANPNNIETTVDLRLSDGRQTSLRIPAMGQRAGFVGEIFGGSPGSFLGTLKIRSGAPVAVLALRGTTNARGQFIFTSIPINAGVPDTSGVKIFPTIVNGGGYNSEVILVNSSPTVSTGSVQFSFEVSSDRGTNKTFDFSIPAGEVWRVRTMGPSTEAVASGYASLVMSGATTMPDAIAILRFSSNAGLISETAVPAQSQMTRSLSFAAVGANTRTGLAIANPLSQNVPITLSAFDNSGEIAAPPGTLTLNSRSQTSAFLDELIAGLPSDFVGYVVMDAAAPVYAISIRGTTDSRGGFLMSTLPMVDLNQAPTGAHYFPHFVDSDSYKTEFLMVSTGVSAPQLSLFGSDGKPIAIGLQ